MIEINVLIITFEQEKLIGRALDSILQQKKHGLNQIIISDDCSSDNNWHVISEYAEKYSDIIKAYRNDNNLGIYGNIENLMNFRGDADMYYIMSGDDALCPGWFQTVQNFINQNNIDVKGEAIAIYSDWKVVTPKGGEHIFTQKHILKKNIDLMSLRLRGLICARSVLQSKNVIDQYKHVDLSRGVNWAENMFDEQVILHSHRNYYCPFLGSIYYSGIGYSLQTYNIEYEKTILENNKIMLQTRDWSKKDVHYLNFLIVKSEIKISPTIYKFIRALTFYICSVDLKTGFSLKLFFRIFINLFASSFIKRNFF